MRARYSVDLDQGPQLLLNGYANADQRQFSEEFQLQSGPSAPVEWQAGLYFIHLDERYLPAGFDYGGSYSARLGGRVSQALYDKGVVSSYAAYGQATVPIGASTRLTGGLRYTIEHRSVEARGQQVFTVAPTIRPISTVPLTTSEPLATSNTFSEATWHVSLDHDLSSAVMGYASVSRGFQSGGWNLQTPQNAPFGPERLDAFEGGFKYRAPHGPLSASASAFYYDYRDLQVSAFTPLGSITTNATSATVYGAEVELTARWRAGSSVSFGAQWLEARFGRFPNATCVNYSQTAAVPYLPLACDVTGNRLPFAPGLKFSLGTVHRLQLGSQGALELAGNVAYNSGYFSEADNVVRQPAFATLDVSAEWVPGPLWPAIRLWAKNLTGAQYYDSVVTFPTMGVLQRPAAPFQAGLSVTRDF